MAALLNFFGSPNKSNATPADSRGTKRKAKADPYEAMDEDDDDDIIPARKTPVSQRTARSRLSSSATTPSSSTRPRVTGVTVPGKRPRGRPSLKSQQAAQQAQQAAQQAQQGGASDTAAASRPNAEANVARAKATATSSMQADSRAPEAPMGGLELLGNNAADAPAASASETQPKPINEPAPQDKGKAKQADAMPTEQARGKDAVEKEEKGEETEDSREEQEIAKLLKHRMASDQSGVVELLVQWVGESEKDATWEIEEEIQQGGEEVLYEYWKAQGGRINALFHKPKNPPPEIYHVFKVLRHEKKNRGGFQFEVQWVGHPATRGETSMEAEPKLKNIAPELLHEYWESVGGRKSHLAQRGRGGKKSRTD